MSEIKVVLYGVGAIGSLIARHLLRRGFKIVGAVDKAEEKMNRDLGEVIGINKKIGVKISRNIDDALGNKKADIAVLATSSYLKEVYHQIMELVKKGLNVISTCEELSYPYVSNPESARKIDLEARKRGVTVLGTGINPGFLMDTLVITLTTVCLEVKKIRVERVIDASKRRVSFQKKMGIGLEKDELFDKIRRKFITGHVGLKESIAMIADALNWRLDKIECEQIKPILSEREFKSSIGIVEAGRVIGLKQISYGVVNGEKKIELTFKAFLGANEYDAIRIEGIPSINQIIKPCVHGDLGTAAVIINLIPKVVEAKAGFIVMKDLLPYSSKVGWQ